jgi:eukaryotic translation initiation factor 2C
LVVANHRGANIVDEDNSLKSAKEHKFMQRNE